MREVWRYYHDDTEGEYVLFMSKGVLLELPEYLREVRQGGLH